ncbi:hypothetical protein CEXT_245981 [Caerostris extrusa]|uniref:Uncharacterized protein n=1 Tax=Caerostris extrusa TaxID=172846 RepID=A0AAV4NM47_CAEEX|nr:hypothetical protein CEXT_245981 [Caerostris extrusa]
MFIDNLQCLLSLQRHTWYVYLLSQTSVIVSVHLITLKRPFSAILHCLFLKRLTLGKLDTRPSNPLFQNMCLYCLISRLERIGRQSLYQHTWYVHPLPSTSLIVPLHLITLRKRGNLSDGPATLSACALRDWSLWASRTRSAAFVMSPSKCSSGGFSFVPTFFSEKNVFVLGEGSFRVVSGV